MCTAISHNGENHYFGRTMDYEISFDEEIVVMPRNYPLKFRHVPDMKTHFAMIGMAVISLDFPLYFDATNEKGLSIAGLNFPDNAVYFPVRDGKQNVAPFELIPWILGQCSDVSEAEQLLNQINLTNEPFSDDFPLSPLHWMVADNKRSITVESISTGLKIYKNPVGVLTNNPTFDKQLFYLNLFMGLSPKEPPNRFSKEVSLRSYSRGMGAMGLPGDNSSSSRFVRATFTKLNSIANIGQEGELTQFFHILASVSQVRGCVELEQGKYVITQYTSCCNTTRGIYYYKTYDNSRICGVDMQSCDLNKNTLVSFPLQKRQDILMMNTRYK